MKTLNEQKNFKLIKLLYNYGVEDPASLLMEIESILYQEAKEEHIEVTDEEIEVVLRRINAYSEGCDISHYGLPVDYKESREYMTSIIRQLLSRKG